MASVSDQKKSLRLRMAEALRQMSPRDRETRSSSLVEKLWAEKRFAASRNIFCYISMPEEVETRGLVRRCLTEGKKIAVPRVIAAEGRIEARGLAGWDGAFIPGPFGILEPDPKTTALWDPRDIDCVIVPGLAFDREGYRLGRGKGYYDRFLAAIGPAAVRIALAFEFQCVDRVPREAHDEKVDLVLSA